jgi:plastocyanin
MDPAAYSVQNPGTTYYILSTFSGNYLWPSGSFRTPVEIEFSQPMTDITFSFATMEFHGGPTGNPSFMNLTAYTDSTASTLTGSTIAQGTWQGEGTPAGDSYPQGTLTFSSVSQPFKFVVIELPYQGSNAASSFLVDNISVTTAGPFLDTVPPVTTISLSGTLGTNGWYTSNVEVSLSPSDDWSGVAKTEFSFDNVAWTAYTSPFSIATEGTTIVYYRSTDVIGNVEAPLSHTVKIDKSGPTGSVVINGDAPSTTSTSVTLKLTSNDLFSGVLKVRYSNDGTWDTEQWENPPTTKTWTLDTELGTKTVYYQIMDNAGIVSATYQDSITLESGLSAVDTIEPVANAGSDRTVNVGTSVSFDAGASSDNVGIVAYEWDCGDGVNHAGKTITHTFNTTGTYTVTLRIRDAAGNEATDTITVTVVQQPFLSDPTSQLWIIAAIIAISLGATAAVLLRKRK